MAPHGHDCPACGAPAGRCCWPMDGARKDGYHQERWNLCKPTETAKAPLGERMRATGLIIASAWADEVDALGARLAAAERSVDRHRLVLDEERRCYGILKAKLAAAETEKATLSTHCVRAERVAQERKEALAVAERERDCGQDGVCAISPGCARHWQERNRELVRERDEAKESAKAAWQQRDYAVAISDAMRCERDDAKEALVSVKQAVAAERERCIRAACAELFKFKMAHRHDQFDEADIAEAIRDGRQAK